MERPAVFISYSHLDEAWKNRVVTQLKTLETQQLIKIWDDRLIGGGENWSSAINSVINVVSVGILLISPNFLASEFIMNEEVPRLLAQSGKGNLRRLIPVVVEPCLWGTVKWLRELNLRPTDGKPLSSLPQAAADAALADLALEIHDLLASSFAISLPPSTPTTVELDSSCPYKGLEVFSEDDEQIFFGREETCDRLVERVNTLPLITLVGASGSGKSSIVQAGLVPRLRRQRNERWGIAIFQPGPMPYQTVAFSLVGVEDPKFTPKSKKRAVELGDELAGGRKTLSAAINETLQKAKGINRLLIVVDQFEELIHEDAEEVRQPFIESLLAAVRDFPQAVTLLLTLRADFIGQVIDLSTELSDLMEKGTVYLRRMKREEMENAIVAPALKMGVVIDPRLTDRILVELEQQPDSLPLLEFTLQQLWEKRTGGQIGLLEYEAIGGVERAISNKADEVLAALGAEKKEAALNTLTKLVRIAGDEDESGDTRRRVDLNTISDEERALLSPFIDARLLVTNSSDRPSSSADPRRNPVLKGETVEVTHEALIRKWDALRNALDRDREFLIWKRNLRFKMNEWRKNDCENWGLLQGRMLAEAKQRLVERPEDLQEERDYILWDERDEYQIDLILASFTDPLTTASTASIKKWFATLLRFDSERAIETARTIPNPESRAEALRELVEVMSGEGRLETASILDEALSAAKSIHGSRGRSRARALKDMVGVLVKFGRLDEALEIAKDIDQPEYRAWAMKELVSVLARAGRFDNALDVANGIADLTSHAGALKDLVRCLVEVGRIDEALEMVTGIDQPEYRAWALNGLVKALARTGRFDQALGIAKSIDKSMSRAESLKELVGALAREGKFAEAQEVWKDIVNKVSRAEALTDLIEELARGGRIDQAVDVAKSIPESHSRAEAIKNLVKSLAGNNQFDEASALAKDIDDPIARAEVLKDLVEMLSENGMVDNASDIARSILEPKIQAGALKELVRGLARVNRLDEAVEIAAKIDEPKARAGALKELVEALAAIGKYDEALVIVNSIYDSMTRAGALKELVIALASNGKLDEALNLADDISDPRARAGASKALIGALVSEGRLDQALDATKSIDDPREFRAPLETLVEALARAGRFDEVIKIETGSNPMGSCYSY